MRRMVFAILILIALQVSPCAADTITLNAGDSYRWNLTQSDYYEYTWPSSSVTEAIVGQNVPTTYYDFQVNIFDHATDLVPFASIEFSGVSMTGYSWNFLQEDKYSKIFDGDMSLEVTVLSGSGLFSMPTVEIINRNNNCVVPLPPSVLLLGSGFLGLAGWRKFRKS